MGWITKTLLCVVWTISAGTGALVSWCDVISGGASVWIRLLFAVAYTAFSGVIMTPFAIIWGHCIEWNLEMDREDRRSQR